MRFNAVPLRLSTGLQLPSVSQRAKKRRKRNPYHICKFARCDQTVPGGENWRRSLTEITSQLESLPPWPQKTCHPYLKLTGMFNSTNIFRDSSAVHLGLFSLKTSKENLTIKSPLARQGWSKTDSGSISYLWGIKRGDKKRYTVCENRNSNVLFSVAALKIREMMRSTSKFIHFIFLFQRHWMWS